MVTWVVFILGWGWGATWKKKGVYIMIIRGYSDLNIQYISQPVTSKYNTTNK